MSQRLLGTWLVHVDYCLKPQTLVTKYAPPGKKYIFIYRRPKFQTFHTYLRKNQVIQASEEGIPMFPPIFKHNVNHHHKGSKPRRGSASRCLKGLARTCTEGDDAFLDRNPETGQ